MHVEGSKLIGKQAIVNNPLHKDFAKIGTILRIEKQVFMKLYKLYAVQFDDEISVVNEIFLDVIK